MPSRVRPTVLVSVLLAAAACGTDGAESEAGTAVDHPPCVRHAEPASGDLAADMVGRWHLVRHYTDTRYYEFHDDGTADVWYVGLGETDTRTTVAWSVDASVVHTGESPPVDFVMALAPSPIGEVWRAPAEYVFRPCQS
jgi:hypothetical protein